MNRETKIRVVASPEKPISEYPLIMRLGVLVRRARLNSGKLLEDIAAELEEEGLNKEVLKMVEDGRWPLSWEQLEAFHSVVGGDMESFQRVLLDFHRAVWMKNNEEGVKLLEQTEKMSKVPVSYDQDELLIALRSAVSTMDVAQGFIERMSRSLRFSGKDRDVELSAEIALLLASSKNYLQTVLENPLEPLPLPEE